MAKGKKILSQTGKFLGSAGKVLGNVSVASIAVTAVGAEAAYKGVKKTAIKSAEITARSSKKAAEKTGEGFVGLKGKVSDLGRRDMAAINNEVIRSDTRKGDDKIKRLYENELNQYLPKIDQYTLDSIYREWAKKLNEYILCSIFKNIIVLDETLKFQNGIKTKHEELKKAKAMVCIYHGIRSIQKDLDYLYFYLPLFLNEYDKQWLKTNILPYFENQDVSGTTFDSFENSFKYVCNTLFKHIGKIERKTNIIGTVIDRESKKFKEHLKEVGVVRLINPWIILSSADDLGNRMLPSLISDKNKRGAFQSFEDCIELWGTLLQDYLPPLILSAQKSTYSVISQIVDRDLHVFKNNNCDERKIKKSMLKRYLQLKVFQESEIYISSSSSIDEWGNEPDKIVRKYTYILKILSNKVQNIDFSLIFPFDMEE